MEELTHSEVRGCQGVGSVTILTIESGGVPLLTAVLTAALGAGHFTDARSKDHLDAASVVTLPGSGGREKKNNKHISLVSMNLPWKV